jgi:exopolysaccharide biosynthesis polyprenyl glycosylphosphotransferase
MAWRGRVEALLVLLDLTAISLAVACAYQIRIVIEGESSPSPWYYPGLALLVGAGWVASLAVVHAYEPRLLGVGTEEFRRVVIATAMVFGVVAVVGYSFQYEVPRVFVAIALPLGLALLALGRLCARKWIQRQRKAGRLQHRVVAIGDHEAAQVLADQVHGEPFAGFTVIGACLPAAGSANSACALPVLGSVDQALDVVKLSAADTVAVTSSAEVTPDVLRRLAWSLEGSGVDLVVAPAVTDVAGPRISVRPVAGLPLLYVDEPTFSGVTRVAKRGLDLAGSLAGLALLGLPMLVIGAVIRITTKGPALFRQTRVGLDGEQFTVLKFRSMYADSEARWAGLMERNENHGLLFKVSDDPRITPVGRFLRRTSLDELPQLLNVVAGHMSLVGPRPLAVDESEMAGHVRRRLLVRPGMTGLWQVSGRKDVSWDDAVRLDLYYVENWSLSLDFTILTRTVLVVCRGEGAY